MDWLIRAFKQKTVHDALLFWLLGSIKHPIFVENSRIYGLDILAHAIRQKSMLDASVWTVNEVCVKEPRVVDKSVQLIKKFVQQQESKNLTMVFMEQVICEKNVLQLINDKLQEGGVNAVTSPCM